MNVTKCDVCGNVSAHEDTIYVEISKVNSNNKPTGNTKSLDLCSVCRDKLYKLLNIEERK